MPEPNDIPVSWLFRPLGLGLAIAALITFPLVASQPQVFNVVIREDMSAPSHLVFRTRVAYRLHIENQGEELQKFAASDFFHAVEIHTPGAVNADRSEIDVPPGEMRDLLFVVGQPGSFKPRSPDYDFALSEWQLTEIVSPPLGCVNGSRQIAGVADAEMSDLVGRRHEIGHHDPHPAGRGGRAYTVWREL